MKHNIQLEHTNSSSHWIQVRKQEKYSVSSSAIEQTEVSELVDALLEEFNQTSAALKTEFRTILRDWLSSMSENDLELVDAKKGKGFHLRNVLNCSDTSEKLRSFANQAVETRVYPKCCILPSA